MIARLLIPIALFASSCTTPPVVEAVQTPVIPAPVVSLMLMQPGDVVAGKIHSSGCFNVSDYTFELTYDESWTLDIVRHELGTREENSLTMELGVADVAQLDWELRYARMEHPVRSTSTTEYSVTWKRGDEVLAREELRDESGAWLNRKALTFTGFFYR